MLCCLHRVQRSVRHAARFHPALQLRSPVFRASRKRCKPRAEIYRAPRVRAVRVGPTQGACGEGESRSSPQLFTPTSPAPAAAHRHTPATQVTASMASMRSGVQLWSWNHAVEVLIHLGARPAVVESLRVAGARPRGPSVGAEEAARDMRKPLSRVVHLPPSLPAVASAPFWSTAAYALTPEQKNARPIRDELQALSGYVTAQIQLDRAGGPIASSTLSKTIESVCRVLGFHFNAMQAPGTPTLDVLLDGHVLASYARFGLEHRLKLPTSVACELSDLQRPLAYLAAQAADDTEVADITALQNGLRRLNSQLLAIPAAVKPTTEELTRAGQFCELGPLWAHIDQIYDALDFSDKSAAAARKVHDSLMLSLCLRESPVTRPSCMWRVRTPGSDKSCDFPGCKRPGCRGNSFRDGWSVLEIAHFKTDKSHALYTIRIDPAGRTARLMSEYMTWGRALLLRGEEATDSLWISNAGRPFGTSKTFATYLPGLLKGCAQLTWTRPDAHGRVSSPPGSPRRRLHPLSI